MIQTRQHLYLLLGRQLLFLLLIADNLDCQIESIRFVFAEENCTEAASSQLRQNLKEIGGILVCPDFHFTPWEGRGYVC